MDDLAVALGLVLVIEGSLWALAPGLGRRVLEAAAATPESQLRMGGAVAAAIGLSLVWFVRG
jgi:uncharacterized protein YjeT (DUF2065 family)